MLKAPMTPELENLLNALAGRLGASSSTSSVRTRSEFYPS